MKYKYIRLIGDRYKIEELKKIAIKHIKIRSFSSFYLNNKICQYNSKCEKFDGAKSMYKNSI